MASGTPEVVAQPTATLVPAATLRATILAQIDAVEQRCAADPAATGACTIVPDQWKSMEQERELLGYIGWLHMPAICGEAPRAYTLALRPFTTADLRDPAQLERYLANRWCRSETPTR